ncbi:YbaB/EbfC family nucleoid-associated protein [Mycoplasmopsis agassizii]|uniref:Nucleoid-associated protein CJF60_04750 n=1 Tax=Mycoplasmopsis agassizii TaxID=33922 RepID=A0ABX4H538_9BACT|nr:YbaB/EbfC family nucleoid-associated protein [Mycoplasmopsis agassizii]PAF55012.1 nucleoid-associated protein, YbaB/EbfC family [Mycoplasmopsis agassizii]SMC17557.1 hypothetical protein SAMN02745179_00489 [Mycoplasmopsis agassizii]
MNNNEMMKLAKKMQAEMKKREKKVQQENFTVEKQGIKVTFNGMRQLKEIKIDDALIDPEDPETLETMIQIAVNEVLEKIDAAYDAIEAEAKNFPF